MLAYLLFCCEAQMKKLQLEKLSDQLQTVEIQKQRTTKTFLDIIGKSDCEIYVTDILAFLLNPLSNAMKDNSCVRYFINLLGCNIDISDEVQITTNKYAWGDYIDLFIYVPNKLAIVVENKIWSGENGNGQQTQKYYDYCENCYKHVTRKYVLIKPDGNSIDAYCNKINGKEIYKTVYYRQLVSDVLKPLTENISLDESYRRILSDFIEHCNRRFIMSTKTKIYDEGTQIYLENFYTIKSLENQYENKMKLIKDIICNHFSTNKTYKVDRDGENTFRFYLDDWYKKNCFYFYYEILFDDGNINNTRCQITLKKYDIRGYENERVHFHKIIDELDNHGYNYQVVSNNWYVYFKSFLNCDKSCTIESFANKAIEELERFADITQSMWEIIKQVNTTAII